MKHFLRCSFTAVSFACALLAPLPLSGQVAAPEAPAKTKTADLPLQGRMQKLIDDSGIRATVCIYVEDAKSGKVLANLEGETPLAPASNNKLITSAAGLAELGPDYHFITKVYHTGKIDDDTLNGNLIVYGGGDPSITGRFEENKTSVTAIMERWADELKSKGIRKIDGSILGDDSFFDDEYFHPQWYARERGEWYSAEVSGLAFNDNCVDLYWDARETLPGETAAVTMNPKTTYVNLNNSVLAVATGRPTERYYERQATSNDILATGTLPTGKTDPDSAAIHDGAAFFVHVLKEVLEEKGIEVTGKAVKKRGAAADLTADNILIEHKSPPLSEIIKIVNLNSQNFYTECVAKTLGKEKVGKGTYKDSTDYIEEFCRKNKIYSKGHDAVDGSGLSGENRVTGRQLVDTLRFMDNHKYRDAWRESIPQGGKRGSLKIRFQGSDDWKAVAPRIYGKTGLIGGVRSLSGWVEDESGREVYYSIILNRLRSSDAPAGMKLIDTIAVDLASLTVEPLLQ